MLLLLADPAEAARVRTALAADGHQVVSARGPADLLGHAGRIQAHALVVDSRVAGQPVSDFVRAVHERDPLLQVILQPPPEVTAPPTLPLARLDVHGCHDPADGPERLRLHVAAALTTRERLAQLTVAERLKTELLANVSHELRTPLNVIIGYVELLRDGSFGALSAEAAMVLEKVLGNAGYLIELVEEFLDLTRLEGGSAPVHRDRVALRPILSDLAESFTLLVRTKPVDFVADIPADLPAVEIDAAKLRVIIQNLLSNAAKFTRAGHIALRAVVEAGMLVVRVSDTGPGIAREHHEAIFDLFRQLPSSEQTKGIGLGLALARRFARALGGDISLESRVGAGTTFTVVLPVGDERKCPQHGADTEQLGV